MNFNFSVKFPSGFCKGFTLLEVMVSVSIIAIVLVSILRLQGQTISMNETIRFYTIAPLLADSKVSEIRLYPSDFDLSSSGDFGDDYPGYTWNVQIDEMKIDVIESAELNLKKIDLVISLNDDELKFSLRHFLNADSGALDE
ncbi:MAG: prepilin-type N-terminal cleavage/methylation domain-containing protein [Desulfobacteraceae bacterium]|nr:prepilin-type N-terminal cleavage/methylation domain-containing protein [Desulfobacteraceae bacterium]MBC2755762.1 prepilin-type N-terminal cleavage/methylation domain-containing protein [Desulfobacteraceae bacterium]